MSPLTVAWTFTASACAMLGFAHFLLWIKEPRSAVYLLSAVMAFGGALSAAVELLLLQTQDLARYQVLLQLENLGVFLLLVPMVWFVYEYFGTARRWFAVTISAIWTFALIVNFLSPASIVFSEIHELKRLNAFWGELFTIAVGRIHPWKIVPDLATVLIGVYVIDASIRAWQKGNRRRAVVIGGSIVFFLVLGGIHTLLVDAGVVATPYMISFAFLAIVMALSYELVNDALLASQFARDLASSEKTRIRTEAELRAKRDELAHLSRVSTMGEMSASFAHELLQPLTAILSNTRAARRYLAEDQPGAGKAEECLDDIERATDRASDVIARMRSLFRKEEMRRERVPVEPMVLEVLELLHSDGVRRGMRVSFDAPPPPAVVHGDRIQLQQVILNVLRNSFDAMRDTPASRREAWVRIELDDGCVRIAVGDRGPGIGDQDAGRIFEPFYTTKSNGLGMGLAISRTIVEAHGGRLTARNNDNGGATFCITLPDGGP